MQVFPQEHERLLVESLQTLRVSVDRQTEPAKFTDDGTQNARIRGPR